MQFTQKSKEHIESCRFCWMCHHICPLGNATGQERHTARGRALGLSLVARDAVEFSEDIVANVYECALCGGCVADCTTGWDPVMFTKEARLGAALDGKLPSYVLKMLSNFQETGNVYGLKNENKFTDFADSDTLFFIGEDARALGCAEEAVKLLRKAGIEFTVLQNEPSSGYSMSFLIGAAAETKAVMEQCATSLAKYKRVICYDPADAKVMKREYKEWGITLVPEVLTFTELLADLIRSGKLPVRKQNLVFTPQDSPLLTRDLEEIEPIRSILSACGEVREMFLHGKETMLAGNLIMNEYMPHIMEKVADNRWNNAKNIDAKIMVTACPAEYILLSKTRPEGIELMKIEEVILKCL